MRLECAVRRMFVALVLASIVALASFARSNADQGVSISTGRIIVNERLSPGGEYRLPAITVTNVGDETGEFEVRIQQLEHVSRGPSESWFRIQPRLFELKPGGSQAVSVAIELPAGAAAGDYEALVEARPVITDKGVTIAAAAASRVSFTVRESSWWSAWRTRSARWIDDNPWSYWGPIVFLVLALVFSLRRRFRFRIERR